MFESYFTLKVNYVNYILYGNENEIVLLWGHPENDPI